ncbi:hypothetical protein BaRGS_00006050 [Batillaria attramentaria]|uniref:Uncharacterized protein n=1 Tax=Batillaria attramentaria TaxID=370345 RepID=A0ABD0LTW0_9CAEN
MKWRGSHQSIVTTEQTHLGTLLSQTWGSQQHPHTGIRVPRHTPPPPSSRTHGPAPRDNNLSESWVALLYMTLPRHSPDRPRLRRPGTPAETAAATCDARSRTNDVTVNRAEKKMSCWTEIT